MMKTAMGQEVYDSLTGCLLPEYRLPWVENAFAPDEPCAELYSNAYDAYQRLCDRLGMMGEDKDVEIIFNSFLEMEKILCIKMFEYGVLCGQKKMPRP